MSMSITCPKCHCVIPSDSITLTLSQSSCHVHNDIILKRKYKYICTECTYHQQWTHDSTLTGVCHKCQEEQKLSHDIHKRLYSSEKYQFSVDMTCDEDECRHDVLITFPHENPIKIHLNLQDIIFLYTRNNMNIPHHFDEYQERDMGMDLFG